MKRKTIDVEYLKTFANAMMAGSDPSQRDVRLGVSLMLEEALMRTGNYKGFHYLEHGSADCDTSRRKYL